MQRNPSAQTAAIGVFDSGLGGLTVARAIHRALPHERLVYLGDTARVPYGTRSPATVVRYARNNMAFISKHHVKLVVVACNTVSAHGLGGLADGSATPLIGVIRPGVVAALRASRGGPVAVLGTPGTIRSNAYELAMHERAPHQEVVQIPCPLFVPLVEEGWTDHPVTYAVAREYLAPLRGTTVDTIILGCTHYPLLRTVITEVACEMVGQPVTVVDSATAVTETVIRLLDELDLRRPPSLLAGGDKDDPRGNPGHDEDLRFFVSDAPARTVELAARFWQEGPIRVEHVDVTL